MRAATVGSAFERHGTGVHLGVRASIWVEPTAHGSGLRAALDGGPEFPIDRSHARAEAGCTVLTDGTRELRTPEHLLAALYGCGITDVLIRATGPEVPILDGSAAPWCEAIAAAGRVEGGPLQPLVLRREFRIEAHGGIADAWPDTAGSAEVVVDFGARGPHGTARVALDGTAFAARVAWARTFVLSDEIEALRAAGRGRGATPENTVIWGPEGPHSPVRSPDEAVQHKLLDLVGDLALVGRPLQARIRVTRGSHRLHHALVAELTAD